MTRVGVRLIPTTGLILGLFAGPYGTWAQLSPTATQPTTPPQTQPATPTDALWLRVTASELNIRVLPDPDSLVVARVPFGTLLRAIDVDTHGWYRVLPPTELFGYVAREYIQPDVDSTGLVSIQTGTLRVRAGSLVQRGDPVTLDVVARLERGERVRILAEDGDWFRITLPDVVRYYVAGTHITVIDADEAQRLLSQGAAVTAAPESDDLPTPPPATAPTPTGPDLGGAWGQRLVPIEKAVTTEANKPFAEQQWDELIVRLRPIAAQREEPLVAALAAGWLEQLERRVQQQETARRAEEILRRSDRDQARHEREMARLRAVRAAATRPAYTASGLLMRSLVAGTGGGADTVAFKLHDPLTRRLEAYLELNPTDRALATQWVGRYVAVSGERRTDATLGTAVVRVTALVDLSDTAVPVTQPAPTRQGR
ncbi:MAG: SH3 domain-containing protein [Phycisphaerales bacterium]|nr:SH3 domain-containing protein [Phycisphaerales bacterium]